MRSATPSTGSPQGAIEAFTDAAYGERLGFESA